MAQGDLEEPMDYNNLGERSAQPLSIGLANFSPLETEEPVGTLSFNSTTGVNTVVITDGDAQFPEGAGLRAVGLQGYFQQDLDGDTTSLHTPSMVVGITDDELRREVVDSASCASCHEWFEGHGGNRVLNMEICTLCHVPNQSSSGRTITDPSDGLLEDFEDADDHDALDPDIDPNNPLTYPEDAQNFKDLVHGIHSADFRTRSFTHVRGGREGYYDWSHITFPRGASSSNCMLCHEDGTYELPLADGLLPTTVRTTGQVDGQDQSIADAETAFENVPNGTDWINSPTSASCFMCHTSADAMDHMAQNGGLLSAPKGPYTNRDDMFRAAESCSVCHGAGRVADLDVVHNK
jgi:OmcA/MtrC family decaheme c-type cytochrome